MDKNTGYLRECASSGQANYHFDVQNDALEVQNEPMEVQKEPLEVQKELLEHRV